MSDYKLLLKGSSLRFITLVSSIGIAFFMMPFIIKSVGDEDYGLWVIIGSVLSFYSVMDLGISSATQRYLSFTLHLKDNNRLNQYLNCSLLIYTCISIFVLAITAIIFISADNIVDDSNSVLQFQIIILVMGSTLAVSFPFYVVNGIIVANMRYDISATINFAKIIIRAGSTYYAISSGYGIIAMAIITSSTDFLSNVLLTYYARKMAPWVRLGRPYINKSTMKELFSYSGYALAGTTADKLRINSAPLFINHMLSLSSVTIYAIGAQFMSYFNQAISSFLTVTFPLFTKNVSLDNKKKIQSDFFLLTKISSSISVIGVTVIVILCQPFVIIWMGEGYIQSVEVVYILIVGTAIVACQQPAVQFFFAVSKNKYHTWMNIVEGLFTLMLYLFLSKLFGINGVALALVVPQVVTRVIIQPIFICKLIAISKLSYFNVLFRPIVVSIIIIGSFLSVPYISTISNYGELLFVAMFITILCLLLSYFLIFNGNDRNIIQSFIWRLLPSIRK
jgi:O-antigen/teichoic acid export membrane protein